MKQKLFFILFLLFAILNGYAQEPVKWHYSAKKIGEKKYELHFMATIEGPWHIYAQDNNEDLTQPTTISFTKNPLIALVGQTDEVGIIIKEKDETSGLFLKYYEDQVDFVQHVTLKANVKTSLTGTIDFMACANGRCLPPAKRRFSIMLANQ